MNKFVILGRERWGGKCLPISDFVGVERGAIDAGQMIFSSRGLDRVVVLDSRFKIVFKVDRVCKCTSVQWRISGELRCEGCGRRVG